MVKYNTLWRRRILQYNTLREENSAVQYTGRRIIVKSDILQEDNGAVYNTMRMIAQYIYIEEEISAVNIVQDEISAVQ